MKNTKNLNKMTRDELIDFGSTIHKTELNNKVFVIMCKYNTKANILSHIKGILKIKE